MLLETKKFQTNHQGNDADSDEPLPCWNLKKEWNFKCKSWIKNSSTAALPN